MSIYIIKRNQTNKFFYPVLFLLLGLLFKAITMVHAGAKQKEKNLFNQSLVTKEYGNFTFCFLKYTSINHFYRVKNCYRNGYFYLCQDSKLFA